jgi:hypothetical protein
MREYPTIRVDGMDLFDLTRMPGVLTAKQWAVRLNENYASIRRAITEGKIPDSGRAWDGTKLILYVPLKHRMLLKRELDRRRKHGLFKPIAVGDENYVAYPDGTLIKRSGILKGRVSRNWSDR